MRYIWKAALGLSLNLPASLFANDYLQLNSQPFVESRIVNVGDPVDSLTPGDYQTTNGYFLNVRIEEWADLHVMQGYMTYGTTAQAFNVTLEPRGNNVFAGHGSVNALYSNGVVCPYPVRVEVRAYTNGIYIRSRQPSSIPTVIYNNICGFAGAMVDVLHPNVYTLID